MALQKQLISVPITNGIDTKTDDKVRPMGKLNRIENAVFDKVLRLQKRNGYNDVSRITSDGFSQVQDIINISSFNSELLAFTQNNLYSQSISVDRFFNKGSVFNVLPTSVPVVRNSFEQSSLDSLVVENLRVVCWQDGVVGAKYSVFDNNTNSFLVSDAVVNSNGKNPRLGVIQNTVYIIYADSNSLKFKSFIILNPSTLSAESTIAFDVDTVHPVIDTDYSDNKVFCAYNSSNAGAKVSVFSISTGDDLSSVAGITGSNGNKCISIYVDTPSNVVVAFSDNSTLKYAVLPFLLGGVSLAPTIVETIAGVTNVTIGELGSKYIFYYEIFNSISINFYIKSNTATVLGVVDSPVVFARSVGLGSKVFVYNGANYLLVLHDSPLQSTYFLMDSAANIVSKISEGLGGAHITAGSLPKVNQISDISFHIVSQIKGKISGDNGTFYSLLGANSTEFDFLPTEAHSTGLLANNLHISGGILQVYDGAVVVEHGFHVYPELITQSATATTGGNMTDGNRGYMAIYKWTDNFGQDEFSAPSPLLEVVLSGGTSTQTASIRVPTLRLTNKKNVVIELYRTEDDGEIFYKVSSNSAPTFNDTSVDSVVIVDTISDAALISRELIYTTGGVLENIAAPSARNVGTYKTRIILVGLEDENKLVYSKNRLDGGPVEFNDTQFILLKSTGGKLVATKEMDEKLIIFKEDAIFYISGNGPNNLGAQDDFTDPELIPTDVGCIDRDSIVLTPQGIFFKSRKGIYLLNRSTEVSYIGADVEAFNSAQITSAVLFPEQNQLRFTTSDSDCLVYNYYLGIWSTFTNHSGLASVLIGDDYYYLRVNGQIYKQDPTSYSDNGTTIKRLIETSWLSVSPQGFQRVYKAFILGDYQSPHMMSFKVAYDFIEAFTQEKIINPSDFIDATAFGDYSPYGFPYDDPEHPFGGDGNVYQVRIDLEQQRCQSIKFRLEDIQEITGAGSSLSSLVLEMGAKAGPNKISKTKQYGTGQATS